MTEHEAEIRKRARKWKDRTSKTVNQVAHDRAVLIFLLDEARGVISERNKTISGFAAEKKQVASAAMTSPLE